MATTEKLLIRKKREKLMIKLIKLIKKYHQLIRLC